MPKLEWGELCLPVCPQFYHLL